MANKKLKLTEEAYKILVESKKPDESFSEYILRTYGKNADRKN